MEQQKIKLDLGFANLVVEVLTSDHPVPEVFVYLEDEDNSQNIAIIRQAVGENDEKLDSVDCLVYADERSEDYNYKFNIGHYKIEK